MKKILALAAVAALATGASVYAANPFSDVSTSDWAYQAVSDLSDQGIVEGYPDGTFKGETNITRYELAQVIARLMAKEDQYTAEQRATIDKLAGEYADELDSLGVRVSNLEKKVGNISWYGDARLRYQDFADAKDGKDGGDKWTGRIRINAKAQVNDTTYVRARLTSGNVNLKDNGDSDVKMDRIEVHHQFGPAELLLGRYDLALGQQVTWLYGNAIDGAQLSAKVADGISLAVGYGRLYDAADAYDIVKKDSQTASTFSDAELFYAQAKADLGVAKLGIDYYKTNRWTTQTQDWDATKEKFVDSADAAVVHESEVYGVNLLVPVGDFRVFGDYYKETQAAGDPAIWTAGIGYGTMSPKKVGSWGIDIAYFDVEAGLYQPGMTGAQITEDFWRDNGSFWFATGDVAIAKNTFIHGEYAFAADADDGKDLGDSWTVSLNYKF